MTDHPLVKLVVPKRAADGGGKVVILDRIEPGETPSYHVHGKTTCYWCGEWCWLGSQTYELVSSGEAAGMCRQCGADLIPQGMTKLGHVDDHGQLFMCDAGCTDPDECSR